MWRNRVTEDSTVGWRLRRNKMVALGSKVCSAYACAFDRRHTESKNPDKTPTTVISSPPGDELAPLLPPSVKEEVP